MKLILHSGVFTQKTDAPRRARNSQEERNKFAANDQYVAKFPKLRSISINAGPIDNTLDLRSCKVGDEQKYTHRAVSGGGEWPHAKSHCSWPAGVTRFSWPIVLHLRIRKHC